MKRSREDHESPIRNAPELSAPPQPAHEDHSSGYSDTTDFNRNNLIKVDESCAIPEIMRCSLPPHEKSLAFSSYDEFEVHYSKFHANRCLECRKNFPSEHFLNVHIEECHDPIILARRDKGEHTFSCFVEDCERKCRTHQKRRLHLIDKHLYPKNYFFAVTKEGIDGRRSLLVERGQRRRKSSASAHSAGLKEDHPRQGWGPGSAGNAPPAVAEKGQSVNVEEEEEEEEEEDSIDEDMADLTGRLSALQVVVPQSIRFGRGRAGFARH